LKPLSVQRNFRKNIRSVSGGGPLMSAPRTSGVTLLCRVLAVIFALALPLSSVALGLNVALRIPDVYAFDMSRTVVEKDLKETVGAAVTSSAIADKMSEYMMHKTDIFQVRAETDTRAYPVFTLGDAAAMEGFRAGLDGVWKFFIVFFPLGLICFVLVPVLRRRAILRRGHFAAMVIYLGTLLGIAIFTQTGGALASFFDEYLGVSFGEYDVLPTLFDRWLSLEAVAVALGVSLVIMLAAQAVVMKLTKGYRVFSRNDVF
jgi:hypothetical protein